MVRYSTGQLSVFFFLRLYRSKCFVGAKEMMCDGCFVRGLLSVS